jgi:hypothetical protein
MIQTWSILLGTMGVVGTGVSAQVLRKKDPERRLQHYWFLGLVALFPAWLIAFLALIQPASEQAVDVPLPPPALFSSGAGLLGIIGTDYVLRRVLNSRTQSSHLVYWLFGCVALLPAWLILLLSL